MVADGQMTWSATASDYAVLTVRLDYSIDTLEGCSFAQIDEATARAVTAASSQHGVNLYSYNHREVPCDTPRTIHARPIGSKRERETVLLPSRSRLHTPSRT